MKVYLFGYKQQVLHSDSEIETIAEMDRGTNAILWVATRLSMLLALCIGVHIVEGACCRIPFSSSTMYASAFAFPAATPSLRSPCSDCPNISKFQGRPRLIIGLSATADSSGGNTSKKKKKKGGLTVNPNLVGSISSSDGIVEVKQERPKSSTLGVPSKRRNKNRSNGQGATTKMTKKERQRTGNGQIDSQKQTLIANKENEPVQVLEAKRGSKVVTIVR